MEPFRVSALGGLAVALLGGPALAQPAPPVHCTASALAGPVYSDGITEEVADIAINCAAESSGAQPEVAAIRLSIAVSLNTSVTNSVDLVQQENLSDAVLVVHGNDCPAPSRQGGTFDTCGAPSRTVQDPQFGRLISVTTLEWTDVVLPLRAVGPSVAATSHRVQAPTIRIRGIRANASQLRLADRAAGAALPIRAAIAVRSSSAVTLQNGMLDVAYPRQALTIESAERVSESTSSGVRSVQASIHIREGFSNALRGGPAADDAAVSTRVLLEFGGVPDDVAVSVPLAVGCQQPVIDGVDPEVAHTLVLGLVTGHRLDGSSGAASLGSLQSEPSVPVEIATGAGLAVFEVQAQDPALLEDCHVPVRFDIPSGQSSGLRIWVAAGLAPRSVTVVASSSAPVPRFAAPPRSDRRQIDLVPDDTTLLFPFVSNQVGFTTGLVVTHGSREALVGTESGSAGACDLHYYGETSEENDFFLVQHTTELEPGEQIVFTLSGGNLDRNIVGIEEFQGYLMVVCGFPGARGYAFITDGFRGVADLAMGYLARVVSVQTNGKRAVIAREPQ